jgi:hypothetical protein
MENLDYAKAHPEKLNLIRSKCSMPHEMMQYLAFIKMDESDLRTILTFKDRDWLCYSSMEECEYFFNRDEKDIPEDKRKEKYTEEDKAMLTEEHFNDVKKNNKSDKVTYDLYMRMRADAYPVKIRIKRK